MKLFTPLILACALLFAGCTKDPLDEYFEDDKKFYNLRAYFDNQINKLNARNQNVRKTITKDGRSEVIEVKTLNWVEELEVFKESDINKPAWRDAYVTDTVYLQKSTVISHDALNEDNPVQHLVVTLDPRTGSCLRVSIDKHTDNFLYNSRQKLFYSAGEGYRIKGSLKVEYLFESEYEVDAEFIDG